MMAKSRYDLLDEELGGFQLIKNRTYLIVEKDNKNKLIKVRGEICDIWVRIYEMKIIYWKRFISKNRLLLRNRQNKKEVSLLLIQSLRPMYLS